jgi:lysozyme
MRVKNVDAIKEHEGLRLKAYKDSVGVWTIGYGDTGPDVVEGLIITKEEVEERLRKRLREFEGYVLKYVRVGMTQNQFDALVSLVYNIGPTNFKDSTLLKKLNAGDYQGAADQFLVWNKGRVDGKLVVINGLTNRRKSERECGLQIY